MRGWTRFGKVSRKLDKDIVLYGRVAREMGLMGACLTIYSRSMLCFFAFVYCPWAIYVLLNVLIVHMFMFVYITHHLPL